VATPAHLTVFMTFFIITVAYIQHNYLHKQYDFFAMSSYELLDCSVMAYLYEQTR
jgi:hypothetical protein